MTAYFVKIPTNFRNLLKKIPSLQQWSQTVSVENYLSCNSCHLRCAFRNRPWRPRGSWRSGRTWGSRQITCRWLTGKVRFCPAGKGKLETWALTTWKVGFQKNFLFFTLFYCRENMKTKTNATLLNKTFIGKSFYCEGKCFVHNLIRRVIIDFLPYYYTTSNCCCHWPGVNTYLFYQRHHKEHGK